MAVESRFLLIKDKKKAVQKIWLFLNHPKLAKISFFLNKINIVVLKLFRVLVSHILWKIPNLQSNLKGKNYKKPSLKLKRQTFKTYWHHSTKKVRNSRTSQKENLKKTRTCLQLLKDV